jgi:hypothetical protein
LKWLSAKSKGRGATRTEIIQHVQIEITEMGASKHRCEEYLKTCMDLGFVYIDGVRFRTTEACENWLKIHI